MNTKEREKRGVPFPRSYWVVPDKFLAGCYPGSRNRDRANQKLRALLEHGIRHVISFMESDEKDRDAESFVFYEDQMGSIAESMELAVTFDRMPVKDLNIPSRVEMCRILDRIDECIEDDRPVYVHCWGGRGRTGTVVGCFLARHGMATGQGALDAIQFLRQDIQDSDKPSPETPQQTEMVRTWAEAQQDDTGLETPCKNCQI